MGGFLARSHIMSQLNRKLFKIIIVNSVDLSEGSSWEAKIMGCQWGSLSVFTISIGEQARGCDLSLLHHNNRQYKPHHTTPPVGLFREFHFCECFDSRLGYTAARCYFCLIDEMDGRQDRLE